MVREHLFDRGCRARLTCRHAGPTISAEPTRWLWWRARDHRLHWTVVKVFDTRLPLPLAPSLSLPLALRVQRLAGPRQLRHGAPHSGRRD